MRASRLRLVLIVLLLAAGCDGGPGSDGTPTGVGPSPRSPDAPATSGGSSADPGPADPDPADPAPADPDPAGSPGATGGGSAAPTFRTAYQWGVPTEPARISHPDRPSAPPPPAPPLPYLVAIEAADHPEAEPGYSRVSFAFRGGFPSYHLEYVAAVRVEGTAEAIPLPGNAFLRVRFVQAQAHDQRGIWTVTASPAPELDYPTLRGYGFAGDFEGYLSYGLGIAVPPSSERALPVRAVETQRPDGTFVVAVDVQHGGLS